jgi:hypothetical protein
MKFEHGLLALILLMQVSCATGSLMGINSKMDRIATSLQSIASRR